LRYRSAAAKTVHSHASSDNNSQVFALRKARGLTADEAVALGLASLD
jgi:hypothetical protein